MSSQVRRGFAGASLRCGFTLIEMLVVIGIIALLLSVLLPSISAAREQAKMVQCLGNLRELGTAHTAYMGRFDGFLIPGYANRAINVNGQFADAENYATMMVNQRLLPAPRAASLTSSTANDPSVLRCPSAQDDLGAAQFSSAVGFNPQPTDRKDETGARAWRCKSLSTGVIVDTWYGWNCTLDQFSIHKEPCRRIPDDNNGSVALITTSQISDPTRMVFLYDGVFLNPHYDADRINARHMRKTYTNILFMDGHAAPFKTANLPGGMGPNASGSDVFIQPALGTHTELLWRTDQK